MFPKFYVQPRCPLGCDKDLEKNDYNSDLCIPMVSLNFQEYSVLIITSSL